MTDATRLEPSDSTDHEEPDVPSRAPRHKRKKPRRRRRFRLTREGKSFVALTVGVGFAAVNTGNNLMYLVLGLLLSMLLVSGMLSDLTLFWIRLKRAAPKRMFVGRPAVVEVSADNHKRWLASYALEFVDLIERSAADAAEEEADGAKEKKDKPTRQERSDHAAGIASVPDRAFFLKINANATRVSSYRLLPRRRGWLRFRGGRAMTRYPFGLIEKSRYLDLDDEVIVFPEIIDATFPDVFGAPRGQERRAQRIGSGEEIAGLREHRPADEERRVHWRRSAALGRLVVREHERDAGRKLSLLLDNHVPRGESPEGESPEGESAERIAQIEHEISLAASLVHLASSHDVSVEIVSRGARSPLVPPGAPRDAALRFLALLPLEERDLPFASSRGAQIMVSAALAKNAPADRLERADLNRDRAALSPSEAAE